MAQSVSFVGAGRVGQSLARLLRLRGYQIGALVRRTAAGAREAVRFVGGGQAATDAVEAGSADIVFLTVPDGSIRDVCQELGTRHIWRPEQTVAHCSGALSLDVLQAAAEKGAAVLCLHPMQSIAAPARGVSSLVGSYYGLEGCERGLAVGKRLVAELEGHALFLAAGEKAAYHAAAAVASNYLVGLMDIGCELLEKAGVPREEAAEALLPLASGTLANIGEKGIRGALTGPIERGDAETVARHLEVLENCDELREIYCLLGGRVLRLASEKGSASKSDLAEVADLLGAGN